MLEILSCGNVGSVRFHEKDSIQVLSVGLASSRKIGDKTFTDWLSVKIWGQRARSLRDHIVIGQKLLVRGRAATAAYSKNDGTLAAELVCHASEIEFLGPKPKTAAEQPAAKPKRTRKPAAADS